MRLVQGEERTRILVERKDFVDRFLYALFKDGRLAAIAQRDLLRGTTAEKLRAADASELPIVLLQMRAAPAGRSPGAAGMG